MDTQRKKFKFEAKLHKQKFWGYGTVFFQKNSLVSIMFDSAIFSGDISHLIFFIREIENIAKERIGNLKAATK